MQTSNETGWMKRHTVLSLAILMIWGLALLSPPALTAPPAETRFRQPLLLAACELPQPPTDGSLLLHSLPIIDGAQAGYGPGRGSARIIYLIPQQQLEVSTYMLARSSAPFEDPLPESAPAYYPYQSESDPAVPLLSIPPFVTVGGEETEAAITGAVTEPQPPVTVDSRQRETLSLTTTAPTPAAPAPATVTTHESTSADSYYYVLDASGRQLGAFRAYEGALRFADEQSARVVNDNGVTLYEARITGAPTSAATTAQATTPPTTTAPTTTQPPAATTTAQETTAAPEATPTSAATTAATSAGGRDSVVGYVNAETLNVYVKMVAAEAGDTWDYDGCLMIAQVLINRVHDGGWGDLYGVLTAPGQFTPWSTGAWKHQVPTPNQERAAMDALDGARILASDVIYFCTLDAYNRSPWFHTLRHTNTYANTMFFARP